MSRIIESILKKNTIRNHEYVLKRFREQFDERQLDTIRADEILAFLTQLTGGKKQTTKRVRYSLLKAFFNFIKNTIDPNLQNPCDTPMMRKIFKAPKLVKWMIPLECLIVSGFKHNASYVASIVLLCVSSTSKRNKFQIYIL